MSIDNPWWWIHMFLRRENHHFQWRGNRLNILESEWYLFAFSQCSNHSGVFHWTTTKRKITLEKHETRKSVPGVGGSIGEASIAFRVFCRFISSTFPLTFVGRLTNDKGRKIGQKLKWNTPYGRTIKIKFLFNCLFIFHQKLIFLQSTYSSSSFFSSFFN